MNIFYPVKNSSGKKNYWRFLLLPVFLLLNIQFSIAANYIRGAWDNWENHELIHVSGNEYYVDITMENSGTDAFGIDFGGTWYSLPSGSIDRYCSYYWFKNNGTDVQDCDFVHNKGIYRFRVWDDSNNGDPHITLTINGIIVSIDGTVKNSDDSYTVTGHFTNANPGIQNIRLVQIAFSEGWSGRYDAEDLDGNPMTSVDAIVQSGETFTATTEFKPSDNIKYTFQCLAIDDKFGDIFSMEQQSFTPGQDPTPSFTDLYIRGDAPGWGVQTDDTWKQTSISPDGNTYTWNWSENPRSLVSGDSKFKIGAIPSDGGWDHSNNYGPYGDNDWTKTIVFTDGISENEVTNSDKARNFTTTEKISKIVLVKTENGGTVTFYAGNNCQALENGFTISGQFNEGVSDGGGLYEGKAVESGEADPANGYWSDGARFIQLTANNVPANYFEWVCTDYAIDGVDQEIVPVIEWTDQYKTSARAELSLPGTYTFVCNAKCNLGDDWTQSDELTITAPVPEMGFNGNIVTNHDWGNPEWAGQADGGYMQRVKGSLVWKSNGFTVDGFGDNEAYHFVIEQRYKLLGCVTNEGWTEHGECGGAEKDNKINRSNLSFTNVAFNNNTRGHNFIAINNSGWTAGVDGTKLQLVVTMTDYDSYEVSLKEYPEECQIQSKFEISAQLNAGEAYPWVGNVVVSGSNTATGGYFADEHRTVTLSTSQVADNYEWVCVQYAIDGTPQTVNNIADVVTINNYDQRSATATLNLPGDYTFRCRAKCAADANHTESDPVTISVYPAMGMDGPILDGSWPSHSIAGQSDHQLTRVKGSLVWSKSFNCSDNGGTTDNYQFVVIQQYKNGCEANTGWAGYEECGPDGAKYNNKINDSYIEFVSNSVKFAGGNNSNFVPVETPSDGAQLTLTVTMTGWDSYTVELSKKQEQIFANYSSSDETKGTVTMKVGDTPIDNGDNITAYIGQQVTLTASPAQGYKVASWEINGKVTVSNSTTIKPTLSGDGLEVVVTFERDCYAGVAYDLTGGGVICANGGSTELSLNTLYNVTYQLYKDGAPYGDPVQGNGEAAKWTISVTGTYTAKAYDSRYEECEEQAIPMKGSADVTSVAAPEISVNPGANVHLTVLQARSFTAKVPVDWSIRSIPADTGGDYCKGDGYMISSRTDTSLVAKFLCVGTAKITATMKDPNQKCMAEVTVTQNAAETEACAPEPEDMQ